MKIDLKDRLVIRQMLPTKGSLVEQSLIKGIMDQVVLTPEDISKYEVKEGGEHIQWKQDIDSSMQLDLTREQVQLLQDTVAKLDTQREIQSSWYDICMRIKDYKFEV